MMNMTIPAAIETYRRALPPGRLMEFSLTPLDRLGIPVQALTLFPSASDSGSAKAWPLCEGIGYGATEDEACVGAYGELTEEVSSSLALARMERVTGSYNEMLSRHGESGVVDPVSLCLEAGSAYTPDKTLEWVEVRRWSTNEPVMIPAEFVACAGMDAPARPGVARLVTPITNGHGAGTNPEMAQVHGLLELLQRDGNSVQYRALARPTAIDLDTITDPVARELLDRYDRTGVQMCVKVAATDFGFVNLYAVGYDRDPATGGLPVMAAACGEAVHPVPAVALRKALLEFASSRARLALFHGPLERVRAVAPEGYLKAYAKILSPADEEPRGLEGMRRWLGFSLEEMRRVLAPVFAVEETVSFDSLAAPAEAEELTSDKEALLRRTVARLTGAGMDVLVADLTTPGSSVCACKMIVPGLEVETMSYHRIGERNVTRLRGRKPTLAEVGNPPPGASPVPLTGPARARLGGDAWLDGPELGALMSDLYVLYREPSRHVTRLSMGEQ